MFGSPQAGLHLFLAQPAAMANGVAGSWLSKHQPSHAQLAAMVTNGPRSGRAELQLCPAEQAPKISLSSHAT